MVWVATVCPFASGRLRVDSEDLMKKPATKQPAFSCATCGCARASFVLTTAIGVALHSGTAIAQQPAASPPASASPATKEAQAPSAAEPFQDTTPATPPDPAAPVDSSHTGSAPPAAPVTTTTPQHQVQAAPANEVSFEEAQPPEVPEPKAFIASLFAMQFELGAGGPLGDIVDAEKNAEVSATYSDGSTKTATPEHMAYHVGFNLEIAPIRARNVKIAIRAGYLYSGISQSVTLGGGQYETKNWSGQLLGTHAALIGPVLYVGKRWYGSFQFLAGPASGTLHPIPLGEQIEGLNVPDYSYSGWMLRLGPGFGYAWKTFLLGGDLLYSRTSISMKESIYPNVGTNTAMHTIGINAHVGLHF